MLNNIVDSIEQCFAAHIVQCCQQYCLALFSIVTPDRRLIQAQQC